MNPISLYLHIPFCEVKCGYCDFFSVPRGFEDFSLQREYVDALIKEVGDRAEAAGGPAGGWTRPAKGAGTPPPVTPPRLRPVSIFFGGGTPSLLEPRLLEKILESLARHFSWDRQTEITLEANPKTVSAERLGEFRKIGINRISIGVQSLNDAFLKALGRIHTSAEAVRTVEEARRVGFRNISIDLIFGLPGQGLGEWQKDLEAALALDTPHLSAYALTVEEGTPFASLSRTGRLRVPEEEESVAMFRWTRERLEKGGLPPYEISNFARPGFESVHNRHTWRYGEYLGFGAGACSFVEGVRRSNRRDLAAYLHAPVACYDEETIDAKTAMGEYCFLGLRLREGFSGQDFSSRFGVRFEDVFAKPVAEAVSRGWLERQGERWQLTPEGILFSNEFFCQLV